MSLTAFLGLTTLAWIWAGVAYAQQGRTVEIDDVLATANVPAAPPTASFGVGSTLQRDSALLSVIGEPSQISGPTTATPEEIASFLHSNSDLAVGSNVAATQFGTGNQAIASIVQSPGSSTSQFQLGEQNISGIGLLNGSLNQVNVGQVGSSLVSAVLLVNSVGTQVVHSQRQSSPYAGVIVINGVPGLRVILP